MSVLPMTPGKRLMYFFTWPWDILAWVFWILPFYALWGRDLRWEEGSLVFNLRDDSWFYKKFYTRWGGTCGGHAIMYAPHVPRSSPDTKLHRIVVHEQFHAKQYEAFMFSAFVLGLIWLFVIGFSASWPLAVTVFSVQWVTGYIFMGVGGWLTALIRGERGYRDAHHEQAAYAVDFKYQSTGSRLT